MDKILKYLLIILTLIWLCLVLLWIKIIIVDNENKNLWRLQTAINQTNTSIIKEITRPTIIVEGRER
jgi:hypothetical protein